MKRSELLDAVVDARIKHIREAWTFEDYLRNALRYGLPNEALVDMTNEELIALLHEHNLTVEDIR